MIPLRSSGGIAPTSVELLGNQALDSSMALSILSFATVSSFSGAILPLSLLVLSTSGSAIPNAAATRQRYLSATSIINADLTEEESNVYLGDLQENIIDLDDDLLVITQWRQALEKGSCRAATLTFQYPCVHNHDFTPPLRLPGLPGLADCRASSATCRGDIVVNSTVRKSDIH